MALLLAAVLSGCSPRYNWRDHRGADAPYTVLFPGKPASQTRPVRLDSRELTMTMTAAEVDGVVFAVGSAEVADAGQAGAAIDAMKRALVGNIGAAIVSEKASGAGKQRMLEVRARGGRNGEPMLLIGRFIASERRIYQVVVMGPEKAIVPDTVDTYLASFKLD